jgi:hypothetical protein
MRRDEKATSLSPVAGRRHSAQLTSAAITPP